MLLPVIKLRAAGGVQCKDTMGAKCHCLHRADICIKTIITEQTQTQSYKQDRIWQECPAMHHN